MKYEIIKAEHGFSVVHSRESSVGDIRHFVTREEADAYVDKMNGVVHPVKTGVRVMPWHEEKHVPYILCGGAAGGADFKIYKGASTLAQAEQFLANYHEFGQSSLYPSESSKHLHLLKEYLPRQNLIEIASGGWPVFPWALTIELPQSEFLHYTAGRSPEVEPIWRGDGFHNLPFLDGAADGLFQSHALEDVAWDDWENVLREWARVIKTGGVFVSLTPDRTRWKEAIARGQPPNCSHRHEPEFGDVSKKGEAVGMRVIVEKFCDEVDYSVLTVMEVL